MQIKDRDVWGEWVKNNQDPYGSGVIRYAERWADLIEAELAAGRALVDVAERASHDADTEGITGFMYGVAVEVLATSWEHGEVLRRWHNRDLAGEEEGEKANAREGAVLNPAILTIRAATD